MSEPQNQPQNPQPEGVPPQQPYHPQYPPQYPQPGQYQQQGAQPYYGYQGQPQAPAPKPKRPMLVVGIVGAVLALLIGAGIVVALVGGSDDDGGDGGKNGGKAGGKGSVKAGFGKTLWTLPLPDAGKPSKETQRFPIGTWLSPIAGMEMPGAWVTSDLLVRGARDGLTGYAIDSGEKKWNWKPPSGAFICDMTDSASKDAGVVLWGKGGACLTIGAVELSSGKMLWEQEIAPIQPQPDGTFAQRDMGYATAAVAGDVVVVDNPAKDIYALSLKDGKELWSLGAKTDTCWLSGSGLVATENQVATITSCEAPGPVGTTQQTVQVLDPASGEPKWTKQLPLEGVGTGRLRTFISADPVSYEETESGKSNFLVSFSDDGQEQPKIDIDAALGKDIGREHPGLDEVSISQRHKRYPNVVVSGSTFATVTNSPEGLPSGTQVVAFDLASGQQRWKSELAASAFPALVGVEGESLAAVDQNGDGKPTMLSFGLTDGKFTQGGPLAKDAAQFLTSGLNKMYSLVDGRLIIATWGTGIGGNSPIAALALG